MANEILTGILVVITAFYAWVTFRILKANEKVVRAMHEQAEAMTRPYISIVPFVEIDNPIFYLRISNIGKSAANNLRFTLEKSFYKFGEISKEKNLSNLNVFNHTIDSFPPNAEIVFSLAQGFKLFDDKADKDILPQSFCITAEYSFRDKVVTEKNFVDLRPYRGANVPQDPYIRKLKDISGALDKVASNLYKAMQHETDMPQSKSSIIPNRTSTKQESEK